MVKNKFLLLIAAVVWLIAGYNVLHIGWIAYINYIKPFDILISVVIFCLFWFLVFHKLVLKHTKRIQSFLEPKQYAWKFFDRKSFFIMFFMIAFGIIIRNFQLLPEEIIAIFYSGLGAALFLAGIQFFRSFLVEMKAKA